MSCPICDKELKQYLIYENEHIEVLLAPEPATSGHIQLFPKAHYQILEQVPQEILAYLSSAANKISILLFELLKVHGTNIIIQNGNPAGQKIPHLSIHIIPRRSDDGLKLDWDLKQAQPEALESMQRIISEGMNKPENKPVAPVIVEEPKPQVPIIKEEIPPVQEEHHHHRPKEKKKNYWLQNLERIP